MSGENIGSSSFKVLDCEGQTNSEEHNQLEGRPCGMPPTSQLPGFRFSGEFAFTSVGVDFAGPVYVKDFYHKSTDMNKATCYTRVGPVVLFISTSSQGCQPKAFLNGFKTFIARRDVLNLVVSDNGSTFTIEELKKQLVEHNIDWKFNAALAPWWGRFFERLVIDQQNAA